MFHSYYLYLEVAMKEKVASLVNDEIKDLNVYVHDAFMSTEEGKTIFNIVLDSEEIIDLNRITEASRIINKIMDANASLLNDCDELDIYSKEKGEE
mgnify:CR=1 FL=1